MLGTIVNALAILCGALLGMLLRNGLKEDYKQIVFHGVSLAVLFIGASGAVGNLIQPSSHPILFILSLIIGGLLGQWWNIELRLEHLGHLIQSKLQKGSKGGNLSQGFVSASLLFCVGTMAIMGSLESGLQGVHKTLFAKSILDGVTSVILSSTLGIGVALAGVSVFIYQGLITLLAQWIEPYMTADMIREISTVGGILIFAIGFGVFLNSLSDVLPFYWITGLAFGFILQRSKFCFAAALRDPFLVGSTVLSKALLISIALTTIGFTAIKYGSYINGQEIPGQNVVISISPALIIGGILFGIGMVLAGGCASGILMRSGEGFLTQIIALVFFIIGSTWGAHDFGWWNEKFISKGIKVFLPDIFGWFGAVIIQLLFMASLYIALDRWGSNEN